MWSKPCKWIVELSAWKLPAKKRLSRTSAQVEPFSSRASWKVANLCILVEISKGYFQSMFKRIALFQQIDWVVPFMILSWGVAILSRLGQSQTRMGSSGQDSVGAGTFWVFFSTSLLDKAWKVLIFCHTYDGKMWRNSGGAPSEQYDWKRDVTHGWPHLTF